MARAGAADHRGPGHLPDHDQDAFGAQSHGGAGLFVLRLLVRLCDLPGRHRPVLGAQPRAGIPQPDQRPVAPGRQPDARAGRDRRGLGLHVFHQLHQPQPAGTALVPGLVSEIPVERRPGRRGGRLGRRLRQAVPGDRGPGETARLQPAAVPGQDGHPAQHRRGRRALHRNGGDRVHPAGQRLHPERGPAPQSRRGGGRQRRAHPAGRRGHGAVRTGDAARHRRTQRQRRDRRGHRRGPLRRQRAPGDPRREETPGPGDEVAAARRPLHHRLRSQHAD